MPDSIFKIIYFIGWLIASFVRQKHAKQTKQNTIVDDRKIGLEKYFVIPGFICFVIIPPVYIFTPLLNFADYTLPLWLGWIGTVIYIFALWLFWRSLANLGRNWSLSVQIRDEHTLVTEGVYRYIRHPLYASGFLTGIATALMLHNWIAGLSWLAISIPIYLTRVDHEEQMMLDNFGKQYEEYMNRTGRLIPRL